MRRIQKVLLLLAVLGIGVLLAYSLTYIKNEKMIDHVAQGNINLSDLSGFGVVYPYIYHYNRGNLEYLSGDYSQAYAEYDKALGYNIPEGKECDVRINAALALLGMIGPIEDLTPDDIDDALNTLYQASDILCEVGCADAEDGDEWHDADAQQLEREILEYIKLLESMKEMQQNSKDDAQSSSENKNNTEQNSGDDSQNKDDENKKEDNANKDDENKNSAKDETKELEEKLKESQRQGAEDRYRTLEYYENNDNFSYYSGDFW